MTPQKSSSSHLKQSSRKITAQLKQRELENKAALQLLESILKKNRSAVFTMPPPNTKVMLLLSGGMDSVATLFLLVKKYRLHVYPIFIKRSQQRTWQELRAARFYTKLVRRQYKGRCEKLAIIEAPIPPKKIRYQLALHSNQPATSSLLSKQLKGLPVYLMPLSAVAVQYACYLELTKKIKIRTIFCAFMAGDGTVMAYETLTALRSIMLSICLQQNDFSWQFTSLALEKELGYFLEKHHLIAWCSQQGISLQHTWSCFFPFRFHCGDCLGCWARKEHFRLAGERDHTTYQRPKRIERVLYRLWKKYAQHTTH